MKRLCCRLSCSLRTIFPFISALKQTPLNHYCTLSAIDFKAFESILQQCTTQKLARQAHAQILCNGLSSNIYLATKLVSNYSDLGLMEDARKLFERMPTADTFLWNVMIRGHAQNGPFEESLNLYDRMQSLGLRPDKHTFPFVLKACGALGGLVRANDVYRDAVREGFDLDPFVTSAAILMYSKLGHLDVARHVFGKMSRRNVVLWSSLISGYVQNCEFEEALRLFSEMQMDDLTPNAVTISRILPASGIDHGRQVHAWVIRQGIAAIRDVKLGLLEMYSRCKMIQDSSKVFDGFEDWKDSMVCNLMIKGLAISGLSEEAINLFQKMRITGTPPDTHTFTFLLNGVADLNVVLQIQGLVVKSGFADDIFVGNSLIVAYAKCRKMALATDRFEEMPVKDEVSWSALIAGYVQSGQSVAALKIFQRMQRLNLGANRATCLSILSACAAISSLQLGKEMHSYVAGCGYWHDTFVGTALIDMYAKCGSLECARKIFGAMSCRRTATWNAMIDAFGIHGKGLKALETFGQMQEAGFTPDYVTFICVLSACSNAGMVEQGWHCFQQMTEKHSLEPKEEHYRCMVGLLGKAGYLQDAWNLIQRMPFRPNANILRSLLTSCKIHGNMELGSHVARLFSQVDPGNAERYSHSFPACPQVEKENSEERKHGSKRSAGKAYIELITHLMHAS